MTKELEAFLIAEPYIVEALARHDEAYDRHPATEAERQIIVDDLETVRNALEQPKLEPVAWMTHSNDLLPMFHKTRESALNWGAEPIPLYTTPPPRAWVGLTDADCENMNTGEIAVAFLTEKILRKRNENSSSP